MQGIGGVVGGVPYPFGRGGGAVVCIGTTAVVVEPMSEVGVSEVVPSLRSYVGGTCT